MKLGAETAAVLRNQFFLLNELDARHRSEPSKRKQKDILWSCA